MSNVFSGGIDIHSENNNINDANNMKKAIKILSKYTILNIPNLFKLNIDQYKHFDKDFHKKPQGEGSNDNIEEKINPINNSLKNKITNWFTSYDYSYWKIYTKYIGTPLLYYIILFLILAIGLICRNYFYVWFCVIFISIFSLLMVIVPFCDYAYVFPCFVCLQWIFMIFVLDLMKLFSIIKS
ncbi:MAG: hypothetical protein LUH05_09840 [Candidatus Gastranaerophilales bacterium]|nr:hypothetical protein [Candidatus Gastranaerophilales bacterium]